MNLLFLFIILTGPYLLLTVAGRRVSRYKLSSHVRARVGLTFFFLFAALGHFTQPDEMSLMLPPSVPNRLALIHLTGILELFGAIGLWAPRLSKATGLSLIFMLLT